VVPPILSKKVEHNLAALR